MLIEVKTHKKAVNVLDKFLPFEAYRRGWILRWQPPQPWGSDPTELRDKKGALLYEWSYEPTLGEVDEVCRRLLSELT